MTLVLHVSNFISCQRETHIRKGSRELFFLEKKISLRCCAICYLTGHSYEHTVPSRAQPALSTHPSISPHYSSEPKVEDTARQPYTIVICYPALIQ